MCGGMFIFFSVILLCCFVLFPSWNMSNTIQGSGLLLLLLSGIAVLWNYNKLSLDAWLNVSENGIFPLSSDLHWQPTVRSGSNLGPVQVACWERVYEGQTVDGVSSHEWLQPWVVKCKLNTGGVEGKVILQTNVWVLKTGYGIKNHTFFFLPL